MSFNYSKTAFDSFIILFNLIQGDLFTSTRVLSTIKQKLNKIVQLINRFSVALGLAPCVFAYQTSEIQTKNKI